MWDCRPIPSLEKELGESPDEEASEISQTMEGWSTVARDGDGVVTLPDVGGKIDGVETFVTLPCFVGSGTLPGCVGAMALPGSLGRMSGVAMYCRLSAVKKSKMNLVCLV